MEKIRHSPCLKKKKKGDPSLPQNYRPINITSACCRLFEKILVKELISYLLSESLISERQFGFLPNRSTVTQLLDCIFDWCNSLDSKSCVDIVYIDIAKCFDSLSHSKLLLVFHSFGITGRVYNWLNSFLTGRYQRVKLSNSFSDYQPILSGSIQGSVIGPIAAILFLSGTLDKAILEPNVKVASFADDTKYYQCLSNCQDSSFLQRTLENFANWASAWQLTVAADKCQVLRLGSCSNRYQLQLQNVILPSVKSCRDLGIIVDSKLNFGIHIKNMLKTAYKTLNCLLRIFVCSSKWAIIHGYKTLVRVKIEFGSQIWSPHNNYGLCDEIEALQRYFTRRLARRLNLPTMSYEERLAYFGLELLEERRLKIDLCTMYQLVHGNVSIDFKKYFQLGYDITRGHNKKVTTRTPRLACSANNFFTRIVPLWNQLESKVVNSPSIASFKNKLSFVDLKPYCNYYRDSKKKSNYKKR